MAEIDPNRSGKKGNTQSLSSAPSKQPPLRLNHFFTYNNYTDPEVLPLVEKLKEFAYKGKIQSEVGENGTPHLQGMIWCKKKCRDTEFKLPKEIHWEKLKDEDDVRGYCSKDDTFDGKFRFEWGFPKPIKLITPDKWWQKELLNIISNDPDERKVYWYWSQEGGVGKSQFCKYLVAKHNCIFIDEGKKADIIFHIMENDMDLCNCVVLDVPRDNGNNISYKSIESIKNGMVFSPKYESKHKLFNSPHVIIFANQEPIYEKLSSDRWVIKNIDIS